MMSEEQALKLLLLSWRARPAPDALRSRVLDSYRRQVSRRAEEEEEMKRCPMCYEEFAPQFRFCPVDGLPLVTEQQPDMLAAVLAEARSDQTDGARAPMPALNMSVAEMIGDDWAPVIVAGTSARAEYQLTLLPEAGLLARLTTEMSAVTAASRLTWPEFKRDPFGFTQRTAVGYSLLLRRGLARENVAYGLVTALVVVLTLVGAVVALEGYHKAYPTLAGNANEGLEVTGWVVNTIPPEQKQEAGPAGMASHGAGGGSLQNKERPGGGGSGGRHEALPAIQGKLPPATWQPPLVAPDPKPPIILNAHLPTPATLEGDPVLFPPDARALPYGDPKSQATELSSGSGDGNGIGDGNGGGVGTGNGNGYGPGEGGNTGGGPKKPGGGGPGDRGGTIDYAKTVFTVHDVTRRAVITAKPEPQFTEEARKNNVTGEVTLRMVLSASGQVLSIVPIKRLPDGLTEKAIEAARKIQFTPAEKDGHKVSQYVSVVYNFNIY